QSHPRRRATDAQALSGALARRAIGTDLVARSADDQTRVEAQEATALSAEMGRAGVIVSRVGRTSATDGTLCGQHRCEARGDLRAEVAMGAARARTRHTFDPADSVCATWIGRDKRRTASAGTQPSG